MLYNMPPIAKVYEALSAVADGRVSLGDGTAEVLSSGRDRTYKVTWSKAAIRSSDAASKFQGYVGYPIIAVLLAREVIDYDRQLAQELAGVQWNQLNKQFKRDYDAAVEHVLKDLAKAMQIRAMAKQIHADLEKLNLAR